MPLSLPDKTALSVWLVEDDQDFREMFAFVLDRTSGLRCDRAFGALNELEALLNGSEMWADPDAVLMDIRLPGRTGIEGVAYLQHRLPRVPVVMLTNVDAPESIFAALQAGASGYLTKESAVDQTVSAIRQACRGGMLMPPAVAQEVRAYFRQKVQAGQGQGAYGLTCREQQVLMLMTGGMAQKQIAAELSISPHTVDNHLRSIYRKLHVQSNIEAVAKAFREGLV